MTAQKRSVLVTVAALGTLLTACDREPSPAGPTPVTTTPAAPSPSPLPTPTPAATPTPPPASNQPPKGQFGLTPEPVNGTVVLEVGDTLRVDGTGFSDANPGDELRLFAKWGDGTKDEVGCGRCRLAHAYTNPGTYECTVEINDGVEDQARAAARVTKTFPVDVRRPEKPGIGSFTATPTTIEGGQSSTLSWSGITNATSCSINQGVGTVACAGGNSSVSPAADTAYTLTATGPGGRTAATASVTVQYCHAISTVVPPYTCATGATQFCEPVPIVATSSSHAQNACDTCFGVGACVHIAAFGWMGLSPAGVREAVFVYQTGCGECVGGACHTAGDILDACGFTTGLRWAP